MRGTPPVLKSLQDLRTTRVLVVHPKDRDCDDLVAQIRRIGCRVEAIWPPPADVPTEAQILFFLFRQEIITAPLIRALSELAPTLTLIGITEVESPAVIEAIARAGTAAVIAKPVRAIGLLTTIILAHNVTVRNLNSSRRIAKLESRLSALRLVEQAKAILISRKGLTEQEAYDTLRTYAMTKRVSLEVICKTVIDADAVFGP